MLGLVENTLTVMKSLVAVVGVICVAVENVDKELLFTSSPPPIDDCAAALRKAKSTLDFPLLELRVAEYDLRVFSRAIALYHTNCRPDSYTYEHYHYQTY